MVFDVAVEECLRVEARCSRLEKGVVTMVQRQILAATLAVAVFAPAFMVAANASDQLFRAIIETGTQILLNESQRSGELNARQLADAQSRLNELGYDAGQPDGVAGSRTREAIRQYQRDQGMQATGVLTLQQLGLLSGSVRSVAASPDDRPLSKQEVAELQRALSSLGFNVGKADGVAGTATGRAISGFLTQRGLDPYQTPVREAQRLILAAAGNPAAVATSAPAGAAAPSVQTQTLAPGDDLLSQIGLTFRDGDVLTGSPTIGISEFAKGMERLSRLLILKAQPDLLDERPATLFFARALAQGEAEPFADLTPFGGWNGANEFQQEDSRQAFLAKYREKLLSMRPVLPIDFADMYDIDLGSYDRDRQQLDIELSIHSAWPFFSDRRFEAPLPFTLPTKWALPPHEARRIIEAVATGEGSGYRQKGVALLRYRLRDVRPNEDGAVLDFVALDITIYADRQLTTAIARMPLPADAVVEGPSAEGDGVPYLNPDYAAVAAVSLDQTLAERASFVTEAYRLRRVAEQRVRRNYVFNGIRPFAAWPMIIPAAQIRTQVEPNASDMAIMRDWLGANAESLGDTVRLPGICKDFNVGDASSDCIINATKSGTTKTIDLAQLAALRDYDWGYASVFQDQSREIVRAAAQFAPTAVAFNVLPSGKEIPTVLALAPHSAWFGVEIDADPQKLADAELDLTVAGKALHKDGQGRDFLLISLVPKSFAYTAAGSTTRKVIDLSQPNAEPLAATYDVLGVKIGMGLAEAEAALKAAAPLDSFKRVAGRVGMGNLGAFVRWERAEPYQAVSEVVVIYFDESDERRPVVAAGRFLKLERDIRPAAEAGLNSKYGPPDGSNNIDYRRYWSSDPVTKARLAGGMDYDDACGHNDSRGFFEANENYRFADAFLSRKCGEVLSARLTDDEVSVVLTNSDLALELAQARRTKEAAAKAEKVKATPEIKF